MTRSNIISFSRTLPWAKAIGMDRPENYGLVSSAVDVVAEYFWNAHRWFFRKKSVNVTINGATEEMPNDVGVIEKITYDDGGYARYIRYSGNDSLDEEYDYSDNTGTEVYKWDDNNDTNGNIVIRLRPVLNSSKTATIIYYKKFNSFDAIPSKYHSEILIGMREFLTTGGIADSGAFVAAINIAKYKNKARQIRKSQISKDRIFGTGVK